MEIVRYKNRKLYLREAKAYVSLSEIDQNLKLGQPLKVICNRTKNEITEDTLLQIAMRQTYNKAALMKLILDGGYTV